MTTLHPPGSTPGTVDGGTVDGDAADGDAADCDAADGDAVGTPDARRQALGLALTCGLLAALVVAVLTRRLLAGLDPAGNPTAGLVFAVLLSGTVLLVRHRMPEPGWAWFGPLGGRRRVPAQLALGLVAAGVLCVGPLARHLLDPGGALEVHRFPLWAAVVTTVAISEEAFLRGALWQAAAAWRGDVAALPLTTVAFALLHVPFYGAGIIPLDLAVGLLFGGLRMVAGGIAAPAAAHGVADIAGWWLR